MLKKTLSLSIQMKILVCCALPWELKTVKNQIKSLNLKTKLDIDYLCTGMGNYEMIYSLTKYLTEHQESDFFLLNIGICGHSFASPQELVQIWRIKHLTLQKELLPPIPFVFAPIAACYSSDTVQTDQNLISDLGFVEMEARGFELVADRFRLPRLILKVPYDHVGEQTQNFDKNQALSMLSTQIDYAALLQRILDRIALQ